MPPASLVKIRMIRKVIRRLRVKWQMTKGRVWFIWTDTKGWQLLTDDDEEL